MISREALNLIVAALLGVAAIVQLAYIVVYHLSARWEKSRVGRVLMSKAIVLFAVLALIFVTFIPGEFTGEIVVRLTVATLLVLALTRQMWMMIRVQREIRSEDQARQTNPGT